jgi:hypothetical protein
MKSYVRILLIFIFLFPVHLFSQSEAGAIFLLIKPSPTMNGMGNIGVALPSLDPYVAYYNPANGIIPYKGYAFSYSNEMVQWLPGLASDIFYNYQVVNVGITPLTHPYQTVLSYHKTFLDLGDQVLTNAQGEIIDVLKSYMKADALTLGVNRIWKFKNSQLHISLGLTRKYVEQLLGASIYRHETRSKNTFFDIGTLISVPQGLKNVIQLLNTDILITPSFGYSMSNIGENVKFFDEQGDPSPRYVRTGVALSVSVLYKSILTLVEWKGGRTASDLLVEVEVDSGFPYFQSHYSYQYGLGDINFMKNIIWSEPDEEIEVNRGTELNILNILYLRAGREINISGRINIRNSGYGLRLKGILDILHFITKNPSISFLNRHLDLRYNFSRLGEKPGHPLENTRFQSISLIINNIEELL